MRSLCLILLFTILLLRNSTAQNETQNLNRFVDDFVTGRPVGSQYEGTKLKSSPDFKESTIYLKNGKITTENLRYNAYLDEMEFQKSGIVYQVTNKRDIDSLELNGHLYECLLLLDRKDRPKMGYAFRLNGNDSLALYVQYLQSYEDPKQFPLAYAEDKPTGYVDDPPRYLLRYPGLGVIELSSVRKRFYEQLKLVSAETAQWARKSKLKTNETGYLQLLDYLIAHF